MRHHRTFPTYGRQLRTWARICHVDDNFTHLWLGFVFQLMLSYGEAVRLRVCVCGVQCHVQGEREAHEEQDCVFSAAFDGL